MDMQSETALKEFELGVRKTIFYGIAASLVLISCGFIQMVFEGSSRGAATQTSPPATQLPSFIPKIAQPTATHSLPALAGNPPPPTSQATHSVEALILDGEHLGWKAQDCSLCHQLPVEAHTAILPWECAACHGGNGACDPRLVTQRQHSGQDPCGECHNGMHGFEAGAASPAGSICAGCHFATAGVMDCTTAAAIVTVGGLLPVSQLNSSCIAWPGQPIGPDNRVQLSVGVTEGNPAVDFVLKDPQGKAYRLSEMLESKPVLLVLGGFT